MRSLFLSRKLALKKRIFTTAVSKHIAIKEYQKILCDFDLFGNTSSSDLLEYFYAVSKNWLKKYGFVDSVLMPFDRYHYLNSSGYDYVIKSDIDVFLTPLFAKWLPDYCNDFYVVHRGFSNDLNIGRFARIAQV